MSGGSRHSIAWRLALGLTVGTAILWLGAAVIAAMVLQRELGEAYDETLRQSAMRLLPLVVHELREGDRRNDRDDQADSGDGDAMVPAPSPDTTPAERRIPALERGERYFTYVVRAPNGAPLVAAADAPAALLKTTLPEGFSVFDGHRSYALTDPRSGYSIVLLERTDHRGEVLRESLSALTLPLAALIPLIVIGIWAFVRFAMRPLNQLRHDIAERDSRNLDPLSAEGHPTELAPIAEAVAALLERLRAALDAERAFAASSAHELRTPIAGALAQTQRLAIELGEGPGAERVKNIEAALHHLADLSEKLLQLSRLDAGFARAETETDLAPILKLVVRDFTASKTHPSRVVLTLAETADLRAGIHPDAFAIAVRNLIANAQLHGLPGGTIEVSAGPGPLLRVVNKGPVVPPETMERIGERFVRGATRAKGSGLGLAIVQAIMTQTGGALSLYSPARDRADGFEAVLVLKRS